MNRGQACTGMMLGSLFRRPGRAYIFEAFAIVAMSGIAWLSEVIPTCPELLQSNAACDSSLFVGPMV